MKTTTKLRKQCACGNVLCVAHEEDERTRSTFCTNAQFADTNTETCHFVHSRRGQGVKTAICVQCGRRHSLKVFKRERVITL